MANEDQRKAFAAYMGGGSGSTTSAGQPIPQYPGSVANPASQYLFNVSFHCLSAGRRSLLVCLLISFQQFPGLGIPPAAPTPPPAAASSIVSYQGLQGLQGGYANQAAFSQGGFPQRPPLLGQGQGQNLSQGQTPPGYAQIPRDYTNQPPLYPPGYNVGWQYSDPNAPQPAGASLVRTAPDSMAPAQRTVSSKMVQSRGKDTDEYFAYRYQTGVEAPPQTEEQTVPVLLCHTCSVCGQMRSAGYHRNHPVIPGKSIVTTPCRKCKKHTTRNRQSSRRRSYTRVRTCTAEEPCDWPRRVIQVDIDNSERRGRRRSRDQIYASWKTDHLRPRIIKEGSSQANIGLRTLQRSLTRDYRSEARMRVSSLSPGRSRYGNIYPGLNEVWPPPDVVRTHSYRRQSPPRPSPRIVELSPSPPPARSRTTRVRYQSESEGRRPRSPVPRSDSRVRMDSHPRPYRTIVPDHRVFSETSTNDAGSETVSRGILKPADMDYETAYRRRTSLRDSQQSTNVEIGGPRVQFASERAGGSHRNDRTDDAKHEDYLRYKNHRYVDRPATPPIDRLERLHIRQSSPSPQRRYDDIRIDRARRISSSPPRRREEIRVRHVSVSPPPNPKCMPPRPPAPPSPGRQTYSGYRHVSRNRVVERARSLTPPSRKRVESEDDVTDSEDEQRGRLIEVRSWKGIDENGQPATFVETRKKVRMLEQGSVSGSDFRPLTDRLAARSWREI